MTQEGTLSSNTSLVGKASGCAAVPHFVYPPSADRGPVRRSGPLLGVAADCFRHDASGELSRLPSFPMLEFACVRTSGSSRSSSSCSSPYHAGATPSACMSLNCHREHAVWSLRDAKGELAHTDCLPFGMDRLAVSTAWTLRKGRMSRASHLGSSLRPC
jgi:hypothetical protein